MRSQNPGYLLKDRVLEVGDFLATAERVAAGGSALDPVIVANLVSPANGGPPSACPNANSSVGCGWGAKSVRLR